MSRRDPLVSLRHMLDYAREVADVVRDRSRGDLEADRQFSLCIIRPLEAAVTSWPDSPE